MAKAPFQSRIVGEGFEAPDQLLANPLNWRRHPKNQQDALEAMLRTVGWVQRVIVNKTTGHIVDAQEFHTTKDLYLTTETRYLLKIANGDAANRARNSAAARFHPARSRSA